MFLPKLMVGGASGRVDKNLPRVHVHLLRLLLLRLLFLKEEEDSRAAAAVHAPDHHGDMRETAN